jgi:pimeloyl-ACP methyl ester carboxylesterase
VIKLRLLGPFRQGEIDRTLLSVHPGPRFLYLHGFASGPASKKGRAVSERLALHGAGVERLDLRVPSLERLSLGAMMATVRGAMGGPRDRVVLLGSSLGGLTAARVAEAEPRACMLVLLAPAFRFAERWRERLGASGWDDWMRSGWLEVMDHATGGTARVHAEFAREAAALDATLGEAPDVRVPTLILHGRKDDVVPVELSRKFAHGRRHVRLVEVDDGHELLAALPEVLAAIERFLAPALGDGG